MRQLLDMVTLVAPFVPNVPAFTAANAIKEAARTFYGTVPALREIVEIDVEPGQAKCDIYPTMIDAEISHIHGVKRSDFDELQYVGSLGVVETTGIPSRYTTQGKRQIHLIPTPKSAETLFVDVSIKPSFNAQYLDNDAFNEDAEILKYGAIAILKSQPNVDWSAPDEVSFYQQEFQSLMNERRIEIAHKFNDQPLQAKIPKFL